MPYGNLSLLLHCVHKKVRRGPELAAFRTKTLNFTRIKHLNWLAKIELRGPRPRNFFSAMVLQIYYVTSCVPTCDSYSALAFRLIRSIHRLFGTRQSYWNDRRLRRVFVCFYSVIFQLTSAKFQTFAYT